MKKWQKWLLVLAIAAALLAAARYFGNPKRQIRTFVFANRDELEAVVQECLAGPPYPGEYKRHTINVWDDFVQFSWSGSGFGASTRYYGFYYSIDEAPHPFLGMEDYTELTQMFGWRWEQRDGDNGCYIENIDGNWYYYEAWF